MRRDVPLDFGKHRQMVAHIGQCMIPQRRRKVHQSRPGVRAPGCRRVCSLCVLAHDMVVLVLCRLAQSWRSDNGHKQRECESGMGVHVDLLDRGCWLPASIAAMCQALYDYNHMKTRVAGRLLPDGPESGLSPLAGVVPRACVVPAGTTLFHMGDSARGIFVLAEGAMRLVRVTPDGVAVTIHQVRPGETFAEASLFGTRYHCDAIADVDSVVGLYPRAKLTAQLRGNPDVLWNFARELAHRLQGLRQRYELKQIRSAPERVLQFMRLRGGDKGRFRVTGRLKDIAAELGLTHEALYRTLAALERRKLITRSEGSFCLVGESRPRVSD